MRQTAEHSRHLLLHCVERLKVRCDFQRHTGRGERDGQDFGFGLGGDANHCGSAWFANEWLAHGL